MILCNRKVVKSCSTGYQSEENLSCDRMAKMERTATENQETCSMEQITYYGDIE